MSGGPAGGFLAAPFFPASISTPHVPCVLFPNGVEGFYPPVGASLGMEGTSLPGPRLRLGFSPGSSVRGVAVLGAGSCLAPPHRRGSQPGWHPLLQVSVVVGHWVRGGMGKTRRTPERGCPSEPGMHGVGVLCQSPGGLCFPSGPHPEERCGGGRWLQSYRHLFLLCAPGGTRG